MFFSKLTFSLRESKHDYQVLVLLLGVCLLTGLLSSCNKESVNEAKATTKVADPLPLMEGNHLENYAKLSLMVSDAFDRKIKVSSPEQLAQDQLRQNQLRSKPLTSETKDESARIMGFKNAAEYNQLMHAMRQEYKAAQISNPEFFQMSQEKRNAWFRQFYLTHKKHQQ